MQKLLLLLLLLPVFSFAQEKEKKVNYAFIPILMYNGSFGAQYGAMASAYFNMNSKDTISPASNIGFVGTYFQNDSYFSVLFSKMYFKEDNYRTKTVVGVANINFQTYVDIPEMPNELLSTYSSKDDTVIKYNTLSMFVYMEGTKKVYNNLFLGARFVFTKKTTNFKVEGIPNEEVNLFGFGLASEFDNRDNVFNPNTGQNAKINTMTFLKSLGSSNQYSRIELQYNRYFSLSSSSVILLRGFGIISTGDDVPFSGKNVVSRDDLRGYTNGKYRANHVYDIQTELRWNFYKRWGMIAFTGVAIATDDFNGTNYSGLLPMIGTGIRFKAITKKNINIGLDVAKGKDDWGLYFRIGETFGK